MIDSLAYIVTALGCVLSIFSMRYLFFGERIVEKEGGAEKIKIGKYELEISKVFGAFLVSVITAIFPLVLLHLEPIHPPSSTSVAAPPDINELNHTNCNELRGEYRLRQKYIFVEKKDIRLIARKGIWHATKCRHLEKNKISLAGSDITDFDIEVVINKEFKHIATGTFSYPSHILIQDGKLINRSFRLAIEEGRRLNCIKEAEGQTCHGIEKSEINKKINKALDIRSNTHERLTKKYCIPTIGEEAGVRILAFVCSNYTRVMKLWHSD